MKMKTHLSKLSSITFLLVLFAMACSDNPTEPVDESGIIINIISGNYQHGETNRQLANPVIVKVVDSNQNPLPDTNIEFKIIAGGGSLNHYFVKTDSIGSAAVLWTTGSRPDPMLKAEAQDQNGITAATYVYANTDLEFTTRWTSGLYIYANGNQLLSHDNRILESKNFLIFSDESSDDMKVLFAKIAEEDFEFLKLRFGISSSEELGINSSDINTKYKIFANRRADCQPGNWSVIVNPALQFYALDSRLFNSLAISQPFIRQGLKHELTHVIELLIIKPENLLTSSTPTWFTEGIAEYNCDYMCSDPAPITTLSQLNNWIQSPHHRNPLLINRWEDFLPDESPRDYYKMFGFVFKYLLDPNVRGKTCIDVKNMLAELSTSHNFPQSLETHMGISFESLRDNLYTLLTDYLTQ